MQSFYVLTFLYWAIALVASGLYAWFAVDIFLSKLPDQSKLSAWWWHQRWLNFLGALAGWIVLWPLVQHFGSCVWSMCSGPVTWTHVAAAVVAFVGITGHLPSVVVSLVGGFASLAGRVAEAVVTWVAGKGPGARG